VILWLALGYHVLSRLAYVVGVGVSLTQQKRHQVFTRAHGVEAGFLKFRRLAAIVMNNDALSFVLLCLATRDTLPFTLSTGLQVGIGAALIVLGVGTKVWAARTLGADAYYWRDVFEPPALPAAPARGPYRVLQNPMYTVGYAHAYGFAILTGSGWGLLAAGFDQAAILLFHILVEKPHFSALTRPGGDRARDSA
jgi:protein-S-isoprenylcysteine O-methyltransferase Ste14